MERRKQWRGCTFNRWSKTYRKKHREEMDYFKQYLIVGGMPQAVEKYVKTKSFKEVDLVKRDILNLYKSDILKYGGDDAIKVQSIFEEIPSQLQKHEKRFTFSALKKEARFRG